MSTAFESSTPIAHAVRLPPAIPDVPIYRFTVEQYHQMIQAGILDEDEQVELLEGWLVPKMTKNPPHDSAIRRLVHLLEGLIVAGWDIHSQSVLALEHGDPEPDVLIVRHEPDDYADRHPTPLDTALVIEVSEKSLSRDRTLKKRMYAQAGIAEYWIINLVDSTVEVYTYPSSIRVAAEYEQSREYDAGQSVPLMIAGERIGEIAVNDVLP